MNVILAVMCTTWAVVKIRPKKNSGMTFAIMGAALYQLSYQVNWELAC